MATNKIIPNNLSTELGKEYIKHIASALKSTKKSASGRLIKSLQSKVVDTANAVNILIHSEDYLEYVDKGRKKGSFPPIKAIAKWARLKGIKQEAVYPIAKKIYKFGIKPTNILDKAEKSYYSSNAFTKFENELGEDIENKLIKDIEEKIKKI